jgi:hypothetical protein
MERLVDKISPETALPGTSRSSPSASADDGQDIDVLEDSITGNAPVLSLLAQPSRSIPTPESENSTQRTTPTKYDKTSRTLHALFPSQHDINIIVNSSPGALFILSLFHSLQDYLDGKTESPASLAVIPPSSSHPALLAKRLLQVTVCLQQLSPSFDEKQLWLRKSLRETIAEYAGTVSSLVTSNDELVGSVEGLECLILQAFYQANAGNLRKGWLSIRRALSLAQLMGIDRRTTTGLRSCDPRSDPSKRASPVLLWYKINFCDRFLSLLLGLPVGSLDNSFAADDQLGRDTPMEKLEKLYTVISARIIERNRATAGEAYALTQSVDCELEVAAKTMPAKWWEIPTLDPFGTPQQMISQMSHMMLQIHHFSLTILLHLPYMLRDPAEGRYDYSKKSCLQASREVLTRFLAFRSLNNTAFSCRHVDYSSLVASMTLLLGHLGRRHNDADGIAAKQRQEDQGLVEQVRAKMEEISILNRDKLSGESADIIKQLFPIIETNRLDCSCNGNSDGSIQQLQLSIPYLGTISINPLLSQASENERQGLGSQNAAPIPSQTPSFDNMANPSLFLSLDPSLQDSAASSAGSEPFLAVDGVDDHTLGLNGGSEVPSFPDFAAEVGDWVFQGVDTTYWTLLNGGISWRT